MSQQPAHSPNNLLGLDFSLEASCLPKLEPDQQIIDLHTHLRGSQTTALYQPVAREFQIGLTYSMTPLSDLPQVREVLGDSVRFIAFPDMLDVMSAGKVKTADYLDQIEQFHEAGARIVKFWAGPRGVDFEQSPLEHGRFALRAPHRLEAAKIAAALGMYSMVHVGDPDVWFERKYASGELYGSKRSQYTALSDHLHEFPAPCIAAHMGGWPENLEFLDAMLTQHPNLYLDMSATRWMVRELSRHSDETLITFLTQWKDRILFGSDIVLDDGMIGDQSPEGITEMISSRYWSYRTMLETEYAGQSTIADPDSADARTFLRGRKLPQDVLRAIYHDTAHTLLEPLHVQFDGNLDDIHSGDLNETRDILSHHSFIRPDIGKLSL